MNDETEDQEQGQDSSEYEDAIDDILSEALPEEDEA